MSLPPPPVGQDTLARLAAALDLPAYRVAGAFVKAGTPLVAPLTLDDGDRLVVLAAARRRQQRHRRTALGW